MVEPGVLFVEPGGACVGVPGDVLVASGVAFVVPGAGLDVAPGPGADVDPVKAVEGCGEV